VTNQDTPSTTLDHSSSVAGHLADDRLAVDQVEAITDTDDAGLNLPRQVEAGALLEMDDLADRHPEGLPGCGCHTPHHRARST
jgi:hypothetical protein